jgi:hypothetical protein
MMRHCLWLAVWAACTSSPAGPTDGPTRAIDGATPLTCAKTVDEYCAGPATCFRMWKDVPTCGRPLSGTRVCSPGMAFVAGGIDTSTTSTYDADGKLVAVIGEGIGHVGCLAGPATYTPPACGAITPIGPCPDAGP